MAGITGPGRQALEIGVLRPGYFSEFGLGFVGVKFWVFFADGPTLSLPHWALLWPESVHLVDSNSSVRQPTFDDRHGIHEVKIMAQK